MEVAVCGKTNTGKSSFFKAATLIDVEISNRTFVTIKPNIGMAYVTAECPCKDLKLKCSPKNSQCVDGKRLIPIKIWDIAGLVPGAHEGRGLGNKFLSDIIKADVLIHIVDASGTTDSEGKPTENHDPSEDVRFLEEEIDLWFASVIKRNLEKIRDKNKATEVLAGLGIRKEHVEGAIVKTGLNPDTLAKELRMLSKPILIAANKIDLPKSESNIKRMKESFPRLTIIPCCAEAEIALRQAAKKCLIEYAPGSNDFKINTEINEQQKKALEFIRERILKKYSSTGVQNCLDKAVFDFLKYIVVYPVEIESKFSSKKGDVLPDAFLMPPNSTALDLAFAVHTDIGKGFLHAVDARTKKRIGADCKLKNGDIISIVSAAK